MKKIWKWILPTALCAVILASCAAHSGPGEGAPDVTQTEGQTDIAALEELEVELYLPNDSADGFVILSETVAASAQGLVDALIAHGVLPEGTAVEHFESESSGTEAREGDVVHYEVGEMSLTLDLSEEFLSALENAGTSGETMVLGSLVNTFLTAYHAAEITLTCGGAAVETGHAVYDRPLTFFDLPCAEE